MTDPPVPAADPLPGDGPAFGHADLSNCERELIHLAGSVQPHGLLLVCEPARLRLQQWSANLAPLCGCPPADLLGQPLEVLGGDLAEQVRRQLPRLAAAEARAFGCRLEPGGHALAAEAWLHRLPDGALVVELEPVGAARPAGFGPPPHDLPAERLAPRLQAAVQQFGRCATIATLAEAVVEAVREITGYDRVMVYRFDPDGHGQVIAEARDPRLTPLLGHHYPASDIPQRARELYLRNRVRLLVDVDGATVPLQPPRRPGGGELDMSLCRLRAMSPMHLEYLRNMGVTATLTVSLVREGRLWGLVAAHHDTRRHLRQPLRVACELLAEVAATRIAAIEHYAQAQVAMLVRRLEQRLIEATSSEGEWQRALFRNPRTLLQPLEATGSALFHDGEILTSGEVPSTAELHALCRWVSAQPGDVFATSSLAQAQPALAALTPLASGVLAVRLSKTRPDHLMWFRKEQLQSVTWAGNPHEAKRGDDPNQLSPRRSFATWSEIVRGTATRWTRAELALARAVGVALVDIIVQVQGVRLLIAEQQLAKIRDTVCSADEPVAITDGSGRLLFANPGFVALTGQGGGGLRELAEAFTTPQALRTMLEGLRQSRLPWRGELALRRDGGPPLPVGLRAEPVPAGDGGLLGMILVLSDLSESRRSAAAREHLQALLRQVGAGADGEATAAAADGEDAPAAAPPADAPAAPAPDAVFAAILTNASLAAMDIGDGAATAAPLLEELEASTRRAAMLYSQLTRP